MFLILSFLGLESYKGVWMPGGNVAKVALNLKHQYGCCLRLKFILINSFAVADIYPPVVCMSETLHWKRV